MLEILEKKTLVSTFQLEQKHFLLTPSMEVVGYRCLQSKFLTCSLQIAIKQLKSTSTTRQTHLTKNARERIKE